MLISSPSPARDGCHKSNASAKAPKRRNWPQTSSGHLPQPSLCLNTGLCRHSSEQELPWPKLHLNPAGHTAPKDTFAAPCPHRRTPSTQRCGEASGGSTRRQHGPARGRSCVPQSTAEQGQAGHSLTSPIVKQPGLKSARCPSQPPKRRIVGQGTAPLVCTEQPEGSQNCWRCLPGPGCDKGERGPQQAPSAQLARASSQRRGTTC